MNNDQHFQIASQQYNRGDPSAAYDVHDNEINDFNDEQDDNRMVIHDRQESHQHNNDDDEGESSMNQEEEFVPDPNQQTLDLNG